MKLRLSRRRSSLASSIVGARKQGCFVYVVVLGFLGLSSLRAADWPQWRGPERTDISKETGLLKSWPKEGPKLLWTYTNAGVGYSGPAVVNGRLYIMGARGDSEFVFALDTKDGKELWASAVGPTFRNGYGDGPRATATVDGELLYALGGQGELVCVETAGGKERWRKSMTKDLQGAVSNHAGGGYGYAWSPLVDGERVICVPGGAAGTLAAVDKKTAKVLWQNPELTEPATYASPLVADIGGVRQYIQMTDRGVAGVASTDGKLQWNYLRKPAYSENAYVATTPVVQDSKIYLTVGVGQGCDLVEIVAADKGFRANRLYANKVMKNPLGGVILLNGYVYGYSDPAGWTCQEFKTGKKAVWAKKSGAGSLTYADGNFYCFGEDEGIAALVEATPAAWKEKGRFEIPRKSQLRKPSGRIWTHPVVADGKLYLRDQDLLFCFDVKAP